MYSLYVLIACCFNVFIFCAHFTTTNDNPIFPKLSSCDVENYNDLTVNSNNKAFVCSMIKDEEGYLAEFVAYYKVHGFKHVIIWNHNSQDNFMEELYPWMQDGFVEVRNVSTLEHLDSVKAADKYRKSVKYLKIMAIKKEIERQCISWGIDHGYDYYLTADLDEYVVPVYNDKHPLHKRRAQDSWSSPTSEPYLSLLDTFVALFQPSVDARVVQYRLNSSSVIPLGAAAIRIGKANFNAAPLVQEPLDLLTIEAHRVRVQTLSRMNIYQRVQPKILYRLSGHDIAAGARLYRNYSYTWAQEVLSSCCYFHGCHGVRREAKPYTICNTVGEYFKGYPETIERTNSSRYWLRMNHYARSLEKFTLKQLTWETANQESNHYDLVEYMHRSHGTYYDPTAAEYSCPVRREIFTRRWEYHAVLLSLPRNYNVSSLIKKYTLLLGLKEEEGGGPAGRVRPRDPHVFIRYGSEWMLRHAYGRSVPGLFFNVTVPPPSSIAAASPGRVEEERVVWYNDATVV